jgi:hypothetical protein
MNEDHLMDSRMNAENINIYIKIVSDLKSWLWCNEEEDDKDVGIWLWASSPKPKTNSKILKAHSCLAMGGNKFSLILLVWRELHQDI